MGPLSGVPGLGPVLGPLLAEVRERAPVYRRWWSRQRGADAETTQPWSAGDEEQLAQLEPLDPWWLRSMADELERVRRDVDGVSGELAGLAGTGIGTPAAATCARLAVSGQEWADALGALVVTLRETGDRVEELLDGAARRVLRVLDAQPASSRAAGPALDVSFTGHAAVLRAVRAELRAGTELLADLADRTARPAPPTWCPGELGCPDPGVAFRWRSGVSGTGRVPEPGDGPLLPELSARRVEPDLGVRIARLPDPGR